ncbi:MAG: antitoxin MazE family protein [Lysobacteraceae bacterium]
MGPTHVDDLVGVHRDALRSAGLRPPQSWELDARHAGFADECRRQSHAVTQADSADQNTQQFLDEALAAVDDWVE